MQYTGKVQFLIALNKMKYTFEPYFFNVCLNDDLANVPI